MKKNPTPFFLYLLTEVSAPVKLESVKPNFRYLCFSESSNSPTFPLAGIYHNKNQQDVFAHLPLSHLVVGVGGPNSILGEGEGKAEKGTEQDKRERKEKEQVAMKDFQGQSIQIVL